MPRKKKEKKEEKNYWRGEEMKGEEDNRQRKGRNMVNLFSPGQQKVDRM